MIDARVVQRYGVGGDGRPAAVEPRNGERAPTKAQVLTGDPDRRQCVHVERARRERTRLHRDRGVGRACRRGLLDGRLPRRREADPIGFEVRH